MTVLERYTKAVSTPWTTSGEDVQYRVEVIERILTISFQGSVSASDWKHNFDFSVRPYKNMKKKWRAHSGFVRLYKSVRDEIFEKIAAIPRTTYDSLHTTGYSLGSALATLLYEDLKFTYPLMKVTGEGFGTPRVIWASWFSGLDFSTFTRWNVWGDIVTSLPFWVFGYRHVGKNKMIGDFSFILPLRHVVAYYKEQLAKVVE